METAVDAGAATLLTEDLQHGQVFEGLRVVDHLLDAVCKKIRKTPQFFLKDLGVHLAILLLARCGMRISEPLSLLRSHYRPDEATLYIEPNLKKIGSSRCRRGRSPDGAATSC